MSGDAGRMVETVLAALYLRGTPQKCALSRSRAPSVLYTLRAELPSIGQAAGVLRRNGFWAEAIALETPGVLSWGECQLESGAALTFGHEHYPSRWLLRLGAQAPPAVWIRGTVPFGPTLGIVGSRSLSLRDGSFTFELGSAAARLGFAVVSGGAPGADSWAIRGALRAAAGLDAPSGDCRAVEIWPCGLMSGKLFAESGDVTYLSVAPPDAPFSTALAMERNALIYAMSEAAVVVRARFKEGGTWHGALDANRHKLTKLIVQEDTCSMAHRALIALGAVPLNSVGGLSQALEASAARAPLFETRELRRAYAA